jgi:hypothetical protein
MQQLLVFSFVRNRRETVMRSCAGGATSEQFDQVVGSRAGSRTRRWRETPC